VQVEVQAVSRDISVPFNVEPDVGIVALLVVFVVLYLWMVWAYIKVGSLVLIYHKALRNLHPSQFRRSSRPQDMRKMYVCLLFCFLSLNAN